MYNNIIFFHTYLYKQVGRRMVLVDIDKSYFCYGDTESLQKMGYDI